ncbi:MAG: hypothetical protein PUD59_03710 [bacterium]|nr:hypothetical protein [bacterium]
MALDEYTLKEGLKSICGTWQVDFIVNGFSDDLAHIPAAEFKSNDGSDFSGITFSFSEDHSMILHNSADGTEAAGTWEQTGLFEFRYTLDGFNQIPDGQFKENAELLTMQGGALCFSIGFILIGMKKIEEGHITGKSAPTA